MPVWNFFLNHGFLIQSVGDQFYDPDDDNVDINDTEYDDDDDEENEYDVDNDDNNRVTLGRS